jgi:amidophosphoribosyltransferase
MGGVFGVVSKDDCVTDLFYGTDYHSHLGTCRGGLAVQNGGDFQRHIHDITTTQFRAKFEQDIETMHGNSGIGVISDYESQPMLVHSHLGTFAIVTVGVINNAEKLVKAAFSGSKTHFTEMSGGGINPTELVATLINQEATFEDGIQRAQDLIEGSCSLLLLTDGCVYAARDKLGRTPIALASKDGAWAAASETSSFPNLGYEVVRHLGPGEIARFTADGEEQLKAPGDRMQICAFLWVYYGYPSSTYEDINTEIVRNRCGAALARRDKGELKIDMVAGIPDSGTGHGIGYAHESGVPYRRPYTKYTPTWPRSFMPQVQATRDLVARMKLIPILELIKGSRILFCEDSIVRGTQLRDAIQRFYKYGAKEIHMRPACPPLAYGCKFLNFSRSKSVMDLAARWAIRDIEGKETDDPAEYANEKSDKYEAMVDKIRESLALTTLKYQYLDDLVTAIGLPKEKLCTYCWDGCEGCGK